MVVAGARRSTVRIMMLRRLAVSVAALALTAGCAAPAAGTTVRPVAAPVAGAATAAPAPVLVGRWACATHVRVLVNPVGGPADALAEVRAWFAAADARDGLHTTVQATTRYLYADATGEQPGEVLVVWGNAADWPDAFGAADDAPAGAYARTYRDVDTAGHLTDAAVLVRTDAPGYVLGHELGHALGLEHGTGLPTYAATTAAGEVAAHCIA